MQNPFQSTTNGQASAGDPLAFIKKLWGDMHLPGMVTPTLSVDELDKQIKDLKTVESWLNVNMNMLRGTIQALEVQRATITTLKAMGESFAQASSASVGSRTPEDEKSHNTWPMHQAAGKVSESQADRENDDEEEDENLDDPTVDVEQGKLQPEPEPAKASQKDAVDEVSEEGLASSFSNPGAWWNLLQEQFKQALGNAIQDEESAKLKMPPTRSKAKPEARVSKEATANRSQSRGKASVKKTVAAADADKTKKAAPKKAVAKNAVKPVLKKTNPTQSTSRKSQAK